MKALHRPHRPVGGVPPVRPSRPPRPRRAIRTTCCCPAGRRRVCLAEQIRDSALAASGLLNRTIGGPSVKPYQPAGLWEQSGHRQDLHAGHGAKLYRRSLYTFWRRTAPPPSMTTFDAVSREVCVARREATVTPLQSLVLLNDPQFVEASRAARASACSSGIRARSRDRHREVFRTLIGRLPDDDARPRILARMFDEQRAVVRAAPRRRG